MKAIETLNDIASKATQEMEERRSLMFAEEAAGYVLQAYGRERALVILRSIAQHIEDHG